LIHLELVNLDDVYHSLRNSPVLANHQDVTTEAGKEALNRLIFDRYEGDSLNILPSCNCGHLIGGQYEGIECPECETICQSTMDRPLESLIWLKAPTGITRLMNPTAWIMLSDALTVSNFNMLEWFCDPSYKPTGKFHPKFQKLDSYKFERGLNYFYENFDKIMDAIFSLRIHKLSGPDGDDIVHWVRMNRNSIFCEYLPMPSKVGFVVETGGAGTFIDKTITLAVDALRTIIGIENPVVPLTGFRRQARATRAIKTLAEYYLKFFKDTLGGKPGIFRKHVFGGRIHYSGRAVISSISEPHDYEELHLPWSLSVQLFKTHLTNKLLRGSEDREPMSPNQIERLLRESTLQYNEIIDNLFKELIREAPHKGIPCLFQRNPSLARGSAQQLFITKVKTDVRVTTISFSTLCLKAPNADYDGDEMNLMLILDKVMYVRLSRMAPHLGAFDLGEPRKLSGNLAIPAPVVATIANYLDHPDQYEGGDKHVVFGPSKRK